MSCDLRVLIVAEHAVLKFGGEAALPFHYFRVLRKRQIPTWMIVHERSRSELEAAFPDDAQRISYIPDTVGHRLLNRMRKIPGMRGRFGDFTLGFMMHLLTQRLQRRLARQLVQQQQVNIVHQPIPVSPAEPSLMYNLGAPVIIGPMNGGMRYPPAFRDRQSMWTDLGLGLGRAMANVMNVLIPGKRRADLLLVANPRTRAALPGTVCKQVIELVENGVDLSLWEPINADDAPQAATDEHPVQLIYFGRLVGFKAVDLLLEAFALAVKQAPMHLNILGEGDQRPELEAQVQRLGLADVVTFAGWLEQSDCARQMRSADVMVMPSLMDCGGATVMEAMAMGLVVIAGNWGGPADYLDEASGILVNLESKQQYVDNFAEAMVKLARSPSLCRQMGRAGRERVERLFDWEAKADLIVQVYQQVLSRQTVSPKNVCAADAIRSK